MNKPRIWITRKLSDATLRRAQRDYDVVVNLKDQPGTKEQIISASFVDQNMLYHAQMVLMP